MKRRTHGWRLDEETPCDASNRKADELRGHDDHPLVCRQGFECVMGLRDGLLGTNS